MGKQRSKPFQILTITVSVFENDFLHFNGFGLGSKIGFSIFFVLVSASKKVFQIYRIKNGF